MKYLLLFISFFIANLVFSQDRELNKVNFISVNNEEKVLEEDSLLKSFVKITLIDEKTFLTKKKLSVNYLIADTTKIRNIKGVIKLPIANGVKKFVDKDVEDETRSTYTYIGQYDFLNVYVIGGMYWEDLDFTFISKKTGKAIHSFGYMPYVSPDKKHIISIYTNPYETEADFELTSIVKNTYKSVFSSGFKNWMPSADNDMFWSDDGNFYVKMLYADEFWKADGNINDNFRYIKITLL